MKIAYVIDMHSSGCELFSNAVVDNLPKKECNSRAETQATAHLISEQKGKRGLRRFELLRNFLLSRAFPPFANVLRDAVSIGQLLNPTPVSGNLTFLRR